MKKRRIKLNLILGILLGIVLAIMMYCLIDIYASLKSNGAKTVEVLDTVDEYGYTLDENDSKYFKEVFKELKKNLESKEMNEEEYATQIAKLFVIDFYSLDYATSKNDIGGVQFIYNEYQESFIHKAKDTIYKYVENDLYDKREQELPVVTSVEVTDIFQETREFDAINDDDAYVVTVRVTYEKDLGYPTECTLILVHRNNILEIASLD